MEVMVVPEELVEHQAVLQTAQRLQVERVQTVVLEVRFLLEGWLDEMV
jgi:rRNA pseudouridine-1189 N-methylase Emg1 (Nep1/Mra1 family)